VGEGLMAVDAEPKTFHLTSSRKVLRLLEELTQSQAGSLIYRQVERVLNDYEAEHLEVEELYAGFVGSLLDAYARGLKPGSASMMEIRLLHKCLQPPLSPSELGALREFIDGQAEHLAQAAHPDLHAFQAAFDPLFQSLGLARAPDPAAPSPAGDRPPPVSPRLSDGAVEAPVETGGSGGDEQRVSAVFRSYLDGKSRDIQHMQTTLAHQIMETIAQNAEFGVLLEVVLGELQQVREGAQVEQLRQTLIREIEKLLRGHRMLADKLDNTHNYLQVVESGSQQLNDELTRVRLLSLTDELTGLPNRRAFLRRLEEEVSRVQRYGSPLSLALLDLDKFKDINDKHGHPAGDEVLRTYAKNVLSLFRHHDLVARYGGEEFAVLLPNTERNGALRALNKVKKRAGEACYQFNGAVRQLPTFSAGLALYQPGETPSALIERADNALYRAKRIGRNRIELDETYATANGANGANGGNGGNGGNGAQRTVGGDPGVPESTPDLKA
jgi:diguanylate cyclase (GGDEF)-like protein